MLNGLQTPFEANLAQLPGRWGRADTYPHYHAGWAMAGNTPFRYFKQSEHRGGQHDALGGALARRHQGQGRDPQPVPPHQRHRAHDHGGGRHRTCPETYHGIPQQPFDGVAMNYSFDDADAPNRQEAPVLRDVRQPRDLGRRLEGGHAARQTDALERLNVGQPLRGRRVGAVPRGRGLLREHEPGRKSIPRNSQELQKVFDEEAWKYNVYPLYDDMIKRLANAVNNVLFGDQKEFVYYAPGAVRIAEKASAPVKGRSHRIETTIDLKGFERRRDHGLRRYDRGLLHVYQGGTRFISTTTSLTASTTPWSRRRCPAWKDSN